MIMIAHHDYATAARKCQRRRSRRRLDQAARSTPKMISASPASLRNQRLWRRCLRLNNPGTAPPSAPPMSSSASGAVAAAAAAEAASAAASTTTTAADTGTARRRAVAGARGAEFGARRRGAPGARRRRRDLPSSRGSKGVAARVARAQAGRKRFKRQIHPKCQ